MKKKLYKKAKSTKNKQFPRNYRIIPERLRGSGLVFFVGLLFMISSILAVSFDLYSNYKKRQNQIIQKDKILSDLAFWEREVKKKPDFRDAYFELALINYQLRDFDKAREYLKKTLSLDPNFERGRELEKLLGSF